MHLISFLLASLAAFSHSGFLQADTECPTVTTVGEDRRSDKTKLRLVQYNVEWLFLDYYAASNCPGDGCTWGNESEAQIHMNYVTNIVKELNPDIINFCEIEGCDELNSLKQNLNDSTYKPYLKKGTDTATGQNVGFLSRVDPTISLQRTEDRYTYPIYGSTCEYKGTTGSYGVSKHYYTEFKINGIPVALIGAHLLAIPTDSTRCAEREAQAQVLQNLIYDFVQEDYEIIMIGDFNDYDGVVLDSNSDKPTSKVLEILKGNSGDLSNKYQLYSAAETIKQSERYSDWYDPNGDCKSSSNEFSMIDHVLVSDYLRNHIVNASIYHGYGEYCGKYNSDHYPVVVDFLF